MTYLQLCQKLASESGTITGTLPTAVTGQTGRLAKMVRWINDAYRQIQTAEPDWKWLESAFTGDTIISQRNYTGSDFGVASRFAEFICSGETTEDRYSIYKSATGVSDETPILFVPWNVFYVEFMRGTQTNDRPQYFTIHPSGELYLHPIPDAVYKVRGPYLKDVQELAADSDEPEMPSRFHDLIVELALLYLGTHDESPRQVPNWQLRAMNRYQQLRRSQMPQMQPSVRFA